MAPTCAASFIFFFFFLFVFDIIFTSSWDKDGPGGGLEGARPRGSKYFVYIYIYSYNIFHLCNGPFQNLRYSFSLISLTNLTKLATIQPKKLTKIIKTFIIVIVF